MNNKNHALLSSSIQHFKKHTGIALVEILSSVVIISVGLLGLAGLQILGTKGTQHAHFKTQATLITQSMIEKIRANPEGDYEQVANCAVSLIDDCAVTSCDENEVAYYDIYRLQCGWMVSGQLIGGIAQSLPNGNMQIDCPTGLCTEGIRVTTTWFERSINQNDIGNAQGMMQKLLSITTVVTN
jgi:type IV pilus assembly protein PilV